jgi:hypothetical protein
MGSGLCETCQAILAPGRIRLCHRCDTRKAAPSKPLYRLHGGQRPSPQKIVRTLVHCPCGCITWGTPGHLRDGQYWCSTCLTVWNDEPATQEVVARVKRLRSYAKRLRPPPRKWDGAAWLAGVTVPPIIALST